MGKVKEWFTEKKYKGLEKRKEQAIKKAPEWFDKYDSVKWKVYISKKEYYEWKKKDFLKEVVKITKDERNTFDSLNKKELAYVLYDLRRDKYGGSSAAVVVAI